MRAAVARIAVAALAACAAAPGPASGEQVPSAGTFSNPVIPGFAPDPSIVRVGNDFYLVNSTFEYFPGIPVYHSRDLVNWDLVSYALSDPAAVNLDRVASGSGIHAPTIRYHADEGRFYVITTNNVDGELVNFVVTAEDARGPWSPPRVIDGAPGIDPSLYFDDDGRAWYVGNRAPPDPAFDGEMEIWLQELDLGRMALTGERHYLWRGCCGGAWAEGPHIYKKDNHFYLLIAEGGTAFEHAVSVAIADDITGPYRNNPRNPVLSHRQLSYDHPITGVGHADLVELADGRWYAVALGWRLVDGRHGILGRETFLLPVAWETEPYWWKEEKLTFPVFSPASGKVELHYRTPFGGTRQRSRSAFEDDFDEAGLGLEWNVRRTPPRPFHSLAARDGMLRLYLQEGAIGENAPYSFVGIRQRDFRFEAVTRMAFAPAAATEEAGLVVMQNDRSAFLMTLTASGDAYRLALTRSLHGDTAELAAAPVDTNELLLRVTGNYLDYGFYYSRDGRAWQALAERVDGTTLSPAVIEGYNYTGVYLGLYATGNGATTPNHADFDYFRYRPLDEDRDDWFRRQRDRALQE